MGSAPFEVKFAKKCSNGHDLKKGDLVMFSGDGGSTTSRDILCMQCDEFTIKYHPTRELVTSKKFCPSCYLELPIVQVDECPFCETKL